MSQLSGRGQESNSNWLVYFGSCGVIATETELTFYMRHKRLMESMVLSYARGLVAPAAGSGQNEKNGRKAIYFQPR
jgi:hypothetical protein